MTADAFFQPHERPVHRSDPSGDEIDRLLNDEVDGLLDEVSCARLVVLLRESPAARERYVDLMTMHADLVWSQAAAGMPLLRTPGEQSSAGLTSDSQRSAGFRWLVTACLAIGAVVLAWSTLGTNMSPRLGTIESVSGTVYFRSGETDRMITAGPSVDVPAGTLVSDDEGATAAFLFVDGTRVTLLGAGEVALANDSTGKHVFVRKGAVTLNAVRQPLGRPLVVETPTAKMQVRGTIFSLSTEGDETHVRVAEGAVEVERVVDGNALLVREGQQCRASLETDAPLTLRSSLATADGFRHVFDQPPPDGWTGQWHVGSSNDPPRVRAIPRIIQRQGSQKPIVEQTITLRGKLDGQLGSVPPAGCLRLTCRVQEKCFFRCMLSVHTLDGDFGGNFQSRLEIPFVVVEGQPAWQTIEVPLEALEPLVSRHPRLEPGMRPFLIYLGTMSADAQLEVSAVAIEPQPMVGVAMPRFSGHTQASLEVHRAED